MTSLLTTGIGQCTPSLGLHQNSGLSPGAHQRHWSPCQWPRMTGNGTVILLTSATTKLMVGWNKQFFFVLKLGSQKYNFVHFSLTFSVCDCGKSSIAYFGHHDLKTNFCIGCDIYFVYLREHSDERRIYDTFWLSHETPNNGDYLVWGPNIYYTGI